MSKLLATFIALMIAVSLSGCSWSIFDSNPDHVSKSLDYKNEATTINNRQGPYANISQEDTIQMIELNKLALEEAKLVDIIELNSRHSEFGNKWNEKYIRGLELYLEGINERNNQKSLRGQKLLDEWGNWYSANFDEIRNK